MKKLKLKVLILIFIIFFLGYHFSQSKHIRQTNCNKNERAISYSTPSVSMYLTKCINKNPKMDIVLFQKTQDMHYTTYTFRVHNKSKYIIKQNTIYMNFNMKTPNEEKENPFKIEAEGNKLNVKPNEQFTITVKVPKTDILQTNLLDMEHPKIEVKGYVEEVSDSHLFQITFQVDNTN